MTVDESIKELEKARDSIEPCLFLDEAIDQAMKTAIEIMHKYQKIEEVYNHQTGWALEMAIKALEQEPTTKNDLGVDAVSREKVWYMITGGKYSDEDDEKFIDRLVNKLAELPSVTPIRPKGHWDIKDNMWWVCSACGCQTRMMKKYNVPNFCPACGADMRGEK